MIDVTERLSKNIKYLMDKAGVENVTELARRLKMTQPTLHRLLAGEVKDPKYITLKTIGDFFKISPASLVDLDLEQSKNSELVTEPEGQYRVHFSSVPVLGNAQLGAGGYWSDMQYPIGNGDGYIRWPTEDQDAYALKCIGDSMMPRIKEGEYVIIEPNHPYHPGDEVLVVTEEGEVMVKTFLFERDGVSHLLPVNEDHAPVRLPSSKISKMHYVAGIAKASLWQP